MVTEVPWNDGTGEKIYLTYGASEGNQTVTITSDAHTGYVTRTKDINFTVSAGSTTITRTLTVNQTGKDIIIITRNDVAMTENDVAVGYVHSPVYELSVPTSTQEFDTGIKLFDIPKSFTILCEATFNNYSWNNGWTQGVFGILDGDANNTFKVGAVNNGKCIVSGEITETANRYTALVMNSTASDKYNTSLFARANSSTTRRIAIRYNADTRLVRGWGTKETTVCYYTVPSDIVSNNTLKLLIGGATGTISIFRVYLGVLTDAEIQAFYDE